MSQQVEIKKEEYKFYTPAGDRVAPVYQNVFDEELKREVVQKTGEFDIYEFIQASATNTDLAMLREQMIRTGTLPVVDDDVQDMSLYPDNIHELYDIVNSAEARFNALPEAIQNVFGNKDVFLRSLVEGTYNDKLNAYADKVIKAASINEPTNKEGDKE